jgi:signal transduction histidine kinase
MVDDERILTRPLSERQLRALDVMACAAYTLVLLTLVLGGATRIDASRAIPLWAAVGMVLVMGVPLAVRRIWPAPAFVVALAASVLGLTLGIVHDDFVGAGFVLYILATTDRTVRREPTLLIAASAVVGVGLLVVAGGPLPVDVGPLLVGIVVLAGSWTIGRAVRERRRFEDRSASQRAQRAVAEERLTIARDLHDIVAHGLSLIVVKAATANHVIDTHPDEARDALQVIETAGRDALAEMRSMLAVLRGADPTNEAAELRPTPALDQLPALVDRVSGAGVRVDLQVTGTAGLPGGVGLSVYRLVQEALTNVVKHAAPARCRVRIAADGGTVQVEVEDDGERAALSRAADEVGHGLIGMRERVRALGGEFDAGPLTGRGFRVVARIPYRAAESTLGGMP